MKNVAGDRQYAHEIVRKCGVVSALGLTLLLILLLAPGLAAGAETEVFIEGLGPITFSVGSETVPEGDQVTVPLTADVPVGNLLLAATIRVEYDPTVVGFVACTENSADFDANICNNDDGDGTPPDSVAFAVVSVSGVDGTVELGTITFVGVAQGITGLTIEVVALEDLSGLQPILTNGQITVTPGVPRSTITVGSDTINVGDATTVPVNLSIPPTGALSLVNINIEFDPTIVGYVTCTANPVGFVFNSCSLSDGNGVPPDVINFTAFASGINGNVQLGELSFSGDAVGISPLHIIVTQFVDGTGQPPTLVDGQITVNSAEPLRTVISVGSDALYQGDTTFPVIPILLDVPSSNLLTALTLRIQFDPAIIGFVSCASNTADFDAGFCNHDDDDGIPPDSVAFTAVSTAGINGIVVLGTLEFEGLAVGISSLHIELEAFEDGSVWNPALIDGTVSVLEPAFSVLFVGSGAARRGEDFTIPVEVQIPAGHTFTSSVFTVLFEDTVLGFVNCSANPAGFVSNTCSLDPPGIEGVGGVTFQTDGGAGVGGDFEIGQITFSGLENEENGTPLEPEIQAWIDTTGNPPQIVPGRGYIMDPTAIELQQLSADREITWWPVLILPVILLLSLVVVARNRFRNER